MITFEKLISITGGQNLALAEDLEIRHISIDSRKSIASPLTLFFAIQGERHDGHLFIKKLVSEGIRQFVVEKTLEIDEGLGNCNIIKVDSAVEALQKLSAFHRKGFAHPIIAITGSSGKTIVKEWLFQLIPKEKVVFRSPKSFNSQVGVPLSVWQLNSYQDLAIIEAGISKPGEMERLERIIRPEIGLFTNIGTAHDAGFSTREEKASEKAKLFVNSDQIIYCADDPIVVSAIKPLKAKKLFSWSSTGADSDLEVSLKRGEKSLACKFGNHEFEVEIPGDDKASIDNSAHCIAVLLCLDIAISKIQDGFKKLAPVSMRLELKKGINNCSIIDDSYNNDLMGLEIALDFLTHQSKKGKKTLILSDILTSGKSDGELYEEVNQLLDKKKISRLIGVGNRLNNSKGKFSLPAKFFATTEELLENLGKLTFDNETVLVKGARDFRLEKVVEKIVLKVHSTVLEINLEALTHNLNFYRSKLKPEVQIMAMVKAFAYGSGNVEIARWLQFHNVNYLAVAYADEGAALRNQNIELPIMVMNPTPDSFDKIISFSLEPEIYSKNILDDLLNYISENSNDRISIHLKLDTGMHRLGFDEDELLEIKESLQNENLKVESVFTHLAAQESPDDDTFTHEQLKHFERMYDLICGWIGRKPNRHVLNSAGILRFPEYQFERVRLGIGLYGVDPIKSQSDLTPVGTFKTIISQVKKIKKGETIGYGRVGKAETDLRIATIPVGYADGYDRRFSDGVGCVLIKGREAKVIGNVCMDMTMINLGKIDAHEGDEVILYGPQNTIHEMASRIGTIPYELLTGIGERVKRVFVTE